MTFTWICVTRLTDVEFFLQSSRSLNWHFYQPFGGTSPNVGLHQPTWGTSKSRWQSFGSALPLLGNASKSLILEDGWLLDTDPRPPASWVLLHSNHWLGYNGATQGQIQHFKKEITYCNHSHRGAIYTVPFSTLISSINPKHGYKEFLGTLKEPLMASSPLYSLLL